MNATILSFYNHKGGVGKTTTCHNFANILNQDKKKILIIDCDPQGNTTDKFINREQLKYGIEDIMLDTNVELPEIVNNVNENLSIIGNTRRLQNVNEQLLLKYEGNERIELLKNVKKLKKDYDYILIDCPPTIDLLTKNALAITDKVIVPLMVDGFAIQGLENLLILLSEFQLEVNPNLEIGGIFLNGYRNTKLHKKIFEQLKTIVPNMLETKIPLSIVLQENSHELTFLTRTYKNKKILNQYRNLVEEVLG